MKIFCFPAKYQVYLSYYQALLIYVFEIFTFKTAYVQEKEILGLSNHYMLLPKI